MQNMPREELLRSSLSGELDRDVAMLKTILNVPLNEDPIFRPCEANGLRFCAVYIEGMADDKKLSDYVLRSLRHSQTHPGITAQQLSDAVVEIAQSDPLAELNALVPKLLSGMSCLLIDGSKEALVFETRNYPHRDVSEPLAEAVVDGSHEGFTEHLRTNVSLLRRYVQSPELVTRMVHVGTRIPTQLAVVYLNGVASEGCVSEVMRRLKRIRAKAVRGTGDVQQLIEDHPLALLPQMLQTERPDRAASCLTDGQVAILAENSPYALIAPVTVFHLIHASDDSFLRWQYGTALRCIRLLGLLVSLLLPAVYLAVTLYHTHLIPMPLLTSIAESRANVPFPVIAEVLFMEFSFYLLNEAGLRTPSRIGSAFGIVGALVLGQAAVSASIISPILIIIIALTGLGNYVVPNYGFGIGVVLYRLGLILLSLMLGLYGVMLGFFLILLQLCAMKSFGVDYFAPIAPLRRHNPDIILRLPVWLQRREMFFSSPGGWMRSKDSHKAAKANGREDA